MITTEVRKLGDDNQIKDMAYKEFQLYSTTIMFEILKQFSINNTYIDNEIEKIIKESKRRLKLKNE